jgi:hypothetical protein
MERGNKKGIASITLQAIGFKKNERQHLGLEEKQDGTSSCRLPQAKRRNVILTTVVEKWHNSALAG